VFDIVFDTITAEVTQIGPRFSPGNKVLKKLMIKRARGSAVTVVKIEDVLSLNSGQFFEFVGGIVLFEPVRDRRVAVSPPKLLPAGHRGRHSDDTVAHHLGRPVVTRLMHQRGSAAEKYFMTG